MTLIKPIPREYLNKRSWGVPLGSLHCGQLTFDELEKLIWRANENAAQKNLSLMGARKEEVCFDGPHYIFTGLFRGSKWLQKFCMIRAHRDKREWLLKVPGWRYEGTGGICNVIPGPSKVAWAGELINRRVTLVQPPPQWLIKLLWNSHDVRAATFAEIDEAGEQPRMFFDGNDTHWAHGTTSDDGTMRIFDRRYPFTSNWAVVATPKVKS